MKNKVKSILKKIRKKVSHYLSTNRLFISFVVFSLIETIILRNYTIHNAFDFKPIICDLALIIIIGAFGYFVKPKKQFNYYMIWLIIFTTMCVVNSIYYIFYTSFASFSLLAELGLVGEVGDSLIEKFRLIDFIYLIFPLCFFLLHSSLKNGSYYHFVSKVENSKKMFGSTILVGVIVLAFTLVNITGTDVSRLVKQWNRLYIVERFGIILYQGNDLVQSLTPKINSLFGYDEAAKEFKEFFAAKFKEDENKQPNEYTDVFKGMNVIFVHMESIQNYLVNMEINGQEITPTINKLSKEGMYFDHFYPQISVGTSSDTEFTLNTSLMPAISGTVFVSYYKRNYVSIPKLLSEQGYYTFSSHANNASMWNRSAMHPRLGYQDMIFKDEFDVNDDNIVGLGLNDVDYFLQLQPKLEEIEKMTISTEDKEAEYSNYMGTLIQLSNHSPFYATNTNPELYNYFGELDLTNTYIDEDGNTVKEKYLTDTKLGNYLITANYADKALGTFFDYVINSEYYNNTIFVLYGDHDARLSMEEYQYYYNHDPATGKNFEPGDVGYVNYDSVSNELNKNTPLIIWTKNEEVRKKINIVNSNVMGMYDLMPTLGNMMGFENKFALGHDIYDIKDKNVVVFPSGNFMTNQFYYNNTSGTHRVIYKKDKNGNDIKENIDISTKYIEELKQYSDKILTVSNNIVVHDLIYKEGDNIQIEEIGTGGSE